MIEKAELYDNLKFICDRRKSYRSFTSEEITAETEKKIIDIALTSPYASSKKNWDIIAVRDRNRLSQAAADVRSAAGELSAFVRDDFRDGYQQYTRFFTFFEEAPLVFFLCYRSPASFSMMFGSDVPIEIREKTGQWERDNYVKSISCVSMLILLAAESLGLGACMMTGPLLAEELIIKTIGVKNDRKIGAVIPVGYY